MRGGEEFVKLSNKLLKTFPQMGKGQILSTGPQFNPKKQTQSGRGKVGMWDVLPNLKKNKKIPNEEELRQFIIKMRLKYDSDDSSPARKAMVVMNRPKNNYSEWLNENVDDPTEFTPPKLLKPDRSW
jgi:hypothetical protein